MVISPGFSAFHLFLNLFPPGMLQILSVTRGCCKLSKFSRKEDSFVGNFASQIFMHDVLKFPTENVYILFPAIFPRGQCGEGASFSVYF